MLHPENIVLRRSHRVGVQILHPWPRRVQIPRPCQITRVQILHPTNRTLRRSDPPGVQILHPLKTTPM
jgi:hypothetical protein